MQVCAISHGAFELVCKNIAVDRLPPIYAPNVRQLRHGTSPTAYLQRSEADGSPMLQTVLRTYMLFCSLRVKMLRGASMHWHVPPHAPMTNSSFSQCGSASLWRYLSRRAAYRRGPCRPTVPNSLSRSATREVNEMQCSGMLGSQGS